MPAAVMAGLVPRLSGLIAAVAGFAVASTVIPGLVPGMTSGTCRMVESAVGDARLSFRTCVTAIRASPGMTVLTSVELSAGRYPTASHGRAFA